MKIITRGFGEGSQQIVTQGYGYSIHIVSPETGNEYQFGGIAPASTEGFKYLKDIINDVIETEKIILGKESIELFVDIKFNGVLPTVYAELESISYAPHQIHIKVTNYT